MSKYDIPVCLFVFRRLDTVKMIMRKLQIVKPSILYVFADGARENKEGEEEKVKSVREYINESINWECKFIPTYSDKNLGYAKNIRNGFSKVLTENPYGIFLEDDAIPSGAFFSYCRILLEKYKDNDKVQYIAGFNGIGDNNIIKTSYTFGQSAPMSGAIATWSNRWFGCDFCMTGSDVGKAKIRNTYDWEMRRFERANEKNVHKNPESEWDIQFDYDMKKKNRFAAVPRGNLAESYGYIDASHIQGDKAGKAMASYMSYTKKSFDFPMTEPDRIERNLEYDKYREYIFVRVNGNVIERYMSYLYIFIKGKCYSCFPPVLWDFLKRMQGCFKKER